MNVFSQDPGVDWLLAGCSPALEILLFIGSAWVGAAAAEGFSRGKGSCAHFPPDSPLLLPQMLFVRQHRGNPHGAADQGFSPTHGRHKLFSRAASGLAMPPRGGKGLPHSTGKNMEIGRKPPPLQRGILIHKVCKEMLGERSQLFIIFSYLGSLETKSYIPQIGRFLNFLWGTTFCVM